MTNLQQTIRLAQVMQELYVVLQHTVTYSAINPEGIICIDIPVDTIGLLKALQKHEIQKTELILNHTVPSVIRFTVQLNLDSEEE